MYKFLKSRKFWIVAGLTIVAAALRFWRLGTPDSFVFDEVYYAKWANDYLQGNNFFDVHPPLGKLIIAAGIFLFGNDSFGWRFFPAIAGTMLIPLTYIVAKRLFTSTESGISNLESRDKPGISQDSASQIALLAALFVTLDGLMLVQSRTALLDIFQITFVLGSVAAFLAWRDAGTRARANFWLIVMGLAIGLAIATKWTAVAVYGVIWIATLIWRKQFPKASWWAFALGYLMLPLAIYLISFIFNERTQDYWHYLIDWHKQTWNFHQNLTASHPYMSRWWSWLYLARPVWYYFTQENGPVQGIVALGNPILWWTAIPALLAAFTVANKKYQSGVFFALLIIISFYLPWTIIGRTQFQYYISPAVPFMMMIVAWWLTEQVTLIRRTIPLLALGSFIFFYPLLTALPISTAFYRLHIWFSSWI